MESSDSSSVKYSYIVLNGRPPSQTLKEIHFNSQAKLIDLSNCILNAEGFNREYFICSMYSNHGEALVDTLTALEYISCDKVIEPSEFIYIIISNYDDKSGEIQRASYERKSFLNLKLNKKKVECSPIRVDVNFQQDTLKYVKQVLGYELNVAWDNVVISSGDNLDTLN